MPMFGRKRRERIQQTRTALEEAAEGKPAGAVDRVVATLINVGIDGAGPLPSARSFAEKELERRASADKAVDGIVGRSVRRGAVGGFVTGIGGFITMPVALPANVLEFYVQATRMVAAIASIRGYDIGRPELRTAVLLTLVGSDAEEVLKKAGITTVSGRVANVALKRLPPAALMVVNKAVGFRLMRGVAERFLVRLGRAVPFFGGFIGAGIDAWMMSRIATNAKKQFPRVRDEQ